MLPAGVLGLITMVATWQLWSLVLVAQLSLVLPPEPSSQVMNTAVLPLVYSGLFRIAGRLFFSQVSANDVPYSQLATDLANNTLPAFSFITPNLIDDMHNGTVAQGRWPARQPRVRLPAPAGLSPPRPATGRRWRPPA